MLYKVEFNLLKNALWKKSLKVSIQMKATEQYFSGLLFVIIYKVALPFESVAEILKLK